MTSSMPDVSFTDGLRRLADLLDEHPEINLRNHQDAIYCGTHSEFIAQVRAFGSQKWKVDADGIYYRLIADLGGGVSVRVFTDLKNVLTRHVENVPIHPSVLALTEAWR